MMLAAFPPSPHLSSGLPALFHFLTRSQLVTALKPSPCGEGHRLARVNTLVYSAYREESHHS